MQTKQAIKHYGTKAALARAVGVDRSAVQRWGDVVPLRRAWIINRKSANKVKMRIGDYR